MFQKPPIHWACQFLSFQILQYKSIFPKTFAILNGPNHMLSNIPCFFLSSFLASHINTISPIRKWSSLLHLSNLAFTLFLYACAFYANICLSWCTPTSWYILLWISFGSSSLSYIKFMIGRPNWTWKTTLIPKQDEMEMHKYPF